MVNIIKANGDKEQFSEEKLMNSIKRAGIPESLRSLVLNHVKEKLHENITTEEIYKHIGEFLGKSEEPYQKTRYMLKQAIMDLGPTGYPFEDFVAKILEHEGYKTKTRTILQGKCINHEIDVIAEKNTVIPTKILVEAKFHNQMGIRTNVHVPMYTKSRYEDVKEKNGFTEVWLITNTKATVDAIAYAACVGMKIITWGYPDNESLRELIEKHKLHPITALFSLSNSNKQTLLSKGIVLCEDLNKNQEKINLLGLSSEEKKSLLEELSFICS